MKIKDIITSPVHFDQKRGHGIFVGDPDGTILAVVCAFSGISKLCNSYDEAVKFEQQLGVWIADAINEKMQRERDEC